MARKVKNWSEMLEEIQFRRSFVYREGCKFVYDSGDLPDGLVGVAPGTVLALRRPHGITATQMPGKAEDWIVIGSGEGGSIPQIVDEDLDEVSTNAVQNKVIKEALDSKVSTVAQNYTDRQKENARTNIGAQKDIASMDDVQPINAALNDRAAVSAEVEGVSKLRSMGYKMLKAYNSQDANTTLAAQITGSTSTAFDTQTSNTKFEVKDYYEINPEVITYPITNVSQYATISSKKYYYGDPIELLAGQVIRITGTVVILNSNRSSVSNLRLDKVYRASSDTTIYLAYTSTKTVTYSYVLVLGNTNSLKINGGKIDNGVLDVSGCEIEATNGWIGENLEIVGKPRAEIYPDWFTDDEDADKIEKAIKTFNSIRLYPRDYNIRRPIIISTSFSIIGSGIPDFFGNYGSVKNASYSASRLIGVGDIPCIIRVCQKTSSYVSAVIRGVDFRPGSGQTRLINGINWSTPNGPSRPVEISNCNFRGLDKGIYIYNKYRVGTLTVGTYFNSYVTQIVFKTLAAGENFSATATLSSKTLTINLTPKTEFIDTRTELEALRDALRNATVMVNGVERTAYYFFTPYDIYGVLTPNKSYTLKNEEDPGFESEDESSTIKSSSTNIDILDIKNCNFYSNNWGVYGSGQHCIMNMNFHDNNAEANINGAVYCNKAFSSIIIKNNLIEGQPTPITIYAEQCYTEVSSNYLESSYPQKITIHDSSSFAAGYINIFGNLTSTGSTDVTWDIALSQSGQYEAVNIKNVGRPLNNHVFLEGATLKEQILSKLQLTRCFFNLDFPFYELPSSNTIQYISTSSTSFTDILDKDLPVAFHHTVSENNLLTPISGMSFSEGLWRFGVLYKTNNISNIFYIGPTGSTSKFLIGTNGVPVDTPDIGNGVKWYFNDVSVLQPITTRVTIYAKPVGDGDEIWWAKPVAFKIAAEYIRESLPTSYTSGKVIVVQPPATELDPAIGSIIDSAVDKDGNKIYGYYKVDVEGLYRVLFRGIKTSLINGYAFYDANDNYIKNSATLYDNSKTEYTKIVPANAKWLKATITEELKNSRYADNVTGYKSATSKVYEPDITPLAPVRTSLTGSIPAGFEMQWNGKFIRWNGSYFVTWPDNVFSPETTISLQGRGAKNNNKQVTITGGASSNVVGILDGYTLNGTSGRVTYNSTYASRYSLIEFKVDNYKTIKFLGLEVTSGYTSGFGFAKFTVLEEEPLDWNSPENKEYYKKSGDFYSPILTTEIPTFVPNTYYSVEMLPSNWDSAAALGTKYYTIDVPEGYTHFLTYSKYSSSSKDYITNTNFYIYGIEKNDYSEPKNMICRGGFWKDPVTDALIIDDTCSFEEAVEKYSKYTVGATGLNYVQINCTTPISGESTMMYYTGTLWKTIPDNIQVQVQTPVVEISNTGILTITCATTGANIYYTIDGTTPTTSSIQYTEPVQLSGGEKIIAIATYTGMLNSDVSEEVDYIIPIAE